MTPPVLSVLTPLHLLHESGKYGTKVVAWLGNHKKIQQARPCTYNVTLRRLPATIVAVEKQQVLHNFTVCICSLSYPACNAHAPYCHLGPVPLYSIFPHYLINIAIFETKKKVTEHKMWVLIFSTTFAWKNFSFWQEIREIWSKMYICLHVKYPLFLSDFNDTWIFSTDFFEKSLYINP